MTGLIRISGGCVWTILADIVGCLMYLVISRNRLSLWKSTIAAAAIMVNEGCFLIMAQGIPEFWWIPSIIATICRTYLFSCICTGRMSWVICLIRGGLLAELAAFLEWQAYTYVSGYWNIRYRICLLVLSVLILFYCSAAGIVGWKYSENRCWKTRVLETFPIIGTALSVFGMINLYVIVSQEGVIQNVQLPALRTGLDFAGLVLFYICSMVYSERTARREIEAMEIIIKQQFRQYQMAQDIIDLINQKYHDFKHQIEILQNTGDNIREEYLKEIKSEIGDYEALNDTGCPVLDTILTSNHLKCLKEKIRLTRVADGRLLEFMDTMDICSVFGNMLDNAIEYEKSLEEGKRMIHLSVLGQKGFLLIQTENYYEGSIFQGELPVSTKKDKAMHGFGLKSIRKTAEKYNGKMTVGVYDNWFEVRVLIPLDQ